MADADGPDTAPSAAMWRQLAERAIGASLDTLESRSADGVTIAPLYTRSTEDPQQPWRPQAAWAVAQRVDHPAADAANRLALVDLEGGADALVLVTAASPFRRGFGLDLAPRSLDVVLDRIELDFISLRLDAGPGTAGALMALATLVADRRLTSAALAVDIGFDPIGWSARLGTAIDDDPRPILDLRAQAGLAGSVYLADGRPWHEAGAGEAQELAAVLATALAYLRRQDALGLTLDAARGHIALLLAADADVGLGLAKFRAMRRLWARVESACGLLPKPVRLNAETSWRMMARHDPWTNVMRATAATFAAGLGGADAIDVLPFTLPLGLPDAAARRLARNVQRVLLDEAHLAKVEDPAAGAGGFEALTDGLCARAWALFQEIERDGGIGRALAQGGLKTRIAETAKARARDIAHLTRGIVGTSRYASLDAPPVDVLDVAATTSPEPGAAALPALRDAAPFESLRDRADLLVPRPQVFLATLGAPAAYGPRATYAVNFFAAAGLAAHADLDARDLAALVDAFKDSGNVIACLCGSNAAYIADAAATAAALRDAGARRIFLAGGSDGSEAEGRIVDAVIHDGCDALHILGGALDLAAASRGAI